MKLHKVKGMPYYRQISNYIEERIIQGVYPAGMKLHTERELAALLGVNRSTVNAAYEELRARGIVESNSKLGTIVTHQSSNPLVNNVLHNLPRLQHHQPSLEQIEKMNYANKMINFATTDLSPDLQPNLILHGLHNSIHLSLEDTHPQGHEELRSVLSQHMREYRQINSTSENTLITAGARQAIYLIASSLLQQGDAIAIGNPSFAYTLPIFHENKFKICHLDIDKEGVNPEQVLYLYKKHRIKMIFVNPTYQNPTGARVTLERKRRLYEICVRYGITIVEDDPSNLNSHIHDHEHTLKSMDRTGNVIYVGSLSKVIGSGAKIGWITASQPIIDYLTLAKIQIDSGMPASTQILVAEILKAEQFPSHISMLQNNLKKKKEAATNIFKKYFKDELDFFEPDGGMHLWCKLNEPNINVKQLHKIATQQNVIFTPGNVFGSDSQYFRISYSSLNVDQIEKGAALLLDSYRILLKE